VPGAPDAARVPMNGGLWRFDPRSRRVEALTHGQPWAGGVLRSIHRYASDGLVLTMLLHMAHHWAFDRYRGFRWFSWVSGLALLWLVYVAGINGYMLPWDRLAKFTVVATAEWLDWLPIFNGTLVRNFIFEENVSDRLFSLLSFIHIGVPLAILALLWVHTQRVPPVTRHRSGRSGPGGWWYRGRCESGK